MKQLLKDPWLEADVIIVKPNWFSPHPTNFTDAETIRMLLESLDSKVVALGRNLVSLDAILCVLIDIDPDKVSYLRIGEETFGLYNRRYVKEAKAAAIDWFPV